MKATGPNVLETELGGGAPAGLSALTPDQRDDLAAAIRAAKRRQTKALAEAGEAALNLIPRLLRGPVRKMFG